MTKYTNEHIEAELDSNRAGSSSSTNAKIQYRQMLALESIAADVHKLANSMVNKYPPVASVPAAPVQEETVPFAQEAYTAVEPTSETISIHRRSRRST